MSHHEDRISIPKEQKPQANPMQGVKFIKPPPVDGGFTKPVLNLDIEKYLEQIEDFELDEEDATELLTTLWDIMSRFVELGFGIDSYSNVTDKTCLKPSPDSTDMLE